MNHFDIIGIGAGPANLSLAALSSKSPNLKTIFFEKQQKYQWHKDMLIPNSLLQVSYLKDLVTLVDPTNKYSFLNFLKKKKCLYQFITSDVDKISRVEFSQYLSWVQDEIKSIKKGEEVLNVSFNGNKIDILTSKNKF
jgi:lysine N6-hydroxylase